MATHTAKEYDVTEMKDLADLYLIKSDLKLVEDIVENFEYVQGYLTASDYKRKSFVSSALIHYRRSFISGVRLKLTRNDIPNEWIELHDEAISVANCHTAHSVNEYECGIASLDVKIQSDVVEVTGIRYGMQGTAEMSAYNFDRLGKLSKYLRENVVNEKMRNLEQKVLLEARKLTQEQLLALPCGLTIGRSSKPDPKKRRQR